MSNIDVIIFFGYLIGITIFGSSFYRRNKTSSAFTTGSNSIPGWVIGMSIFATFVSSISYLALPGQAFMSNWNAFVFSLSIPFAIIVAVKFFVPHYRKINSPSAYTYLEDRFGSWARIYVSTCYLLTQLMRIGIILYLLALAIHAVFGWSIAAIIIVTGITVIIYSVLGGIQAVVWTDAIQGIILIAGALFCTGYILFDLPGGPGQLFAVASSENKFSLGSFNLNMVESTFWVVFIYGIFINLQNYGIDQNYVQRYVAARSEKEAKRSALYGGLLYIPVSMLFLFIGTALFVFYNSAAAGLPAELMEAAQSDRVFPYFIVQELPVGITGLLIASIFAAGMSTISTSLNSSATVFLTDYYERYFKKSATEKESMSFLYIATFSIGLTGIGIGLSLMNVTSALDAWWKLSSIFSGGMLGVFLLGIFTNAGSSTGAVLGVLSGIVVIAWLSLTKLFQLEETLVYQIHSYMTIVLGTTAIFLVGFLISLLNKSSESKKSENVT
ncbi:sodium:solute symporter [Fodinibius sediminis]|uniref:Solute:Na+ symporter, SSS family n=1 Tax=Fodinibius sediminis TaxID=1214077 RepID=A0A521BTR7_9BACT|nr:sodium:solute symporter [Fodinibius sediminis]SMO50549.1 solute:Na+ symporter, SSS family [Fodinibius sediminis]